jgi:hypothetical protein
MTTQAQGQTRAVAAKKNHLRNPSGGNANSVAFLLLRSSFSILG